MKKLLSLLLAFVLVLSFVSCVEGDSGSESGNKSKKDRSESSDTEKTAGNEITLEAFTPIDNEACSVTVKGIDPDNMWGYSVKLAFENKSSEKTYMYSVTSATVNGVQTDPFFAATVAPGKKSNETVSFPSDLKENGITDITDIELFFRIYDDDDVFADPVAEESFHIYPYGEDKATVFVREPQASDVILADNEIVKIIMTGTYDDDIWGYTLKLFVENKTDAEIMISADEVSVNGYMADPFFAKSVMPGKCAFASMSWSDSAFEENDITEVEEIEFALQVYDSNDWSGDELFRDVIKINP